LLAEASFGREIRQSKKALTLPDCLQSAFVALQVLMWLPRRSVFKSDDLIWLRSRFDSLDDN
jgi:hypothetical protein